MSNDTHDNPGDVALLVEKQIEQRVAMALVNLLCPGNTDIQRRLKDAMEETDLVGMSEAVRIALKKRLEQDNEIAILKQQLEAERLQRGQEMQRWVYDKRTSSGTTIGSSLSEILGLTGGSTSDNT